jgi:NAD(P)-dependent dehydrogenase (short-subunit alcohol dehydrogenase family)
MDMGLSGKTVIVTGATANIGRAIALEMAGEGVNLVAVGRDQDAGARVVAEALERGAGGARFLAVDLLDADCGDRIVSQTLDAFGSVDILVNNVGGNSAMGFFAESDPASWAADIDITFMSVLRMSRAALPPMIAQKSGKIINIGSTAGIVGDHMLSVYSAAKAAVHGFTRILAKEVGRHGICVNCVAPYATLASDPAAFSAGSRFHPQNGFFTQAVAGIDPGELRHLHRAGPLDRTTARPEEIAAAVIYLASAKADFITGEVLPVSGGVML